MGHAVLVVDQNPHLLNRARSVFLAARLRLQHCTLFLVYIEFAQKEWLSSKILPVSSALVLVRDINS